MRVGGDDPPKPKNGWHDLPRMARLARVMYPALAEPQYRRELKELSANEQKTDPLTAKQRNDQARSNAARVNYQRKWR